MSSDGLYRNDLLARQWRQLMDDYADNRGLVERRARSLGLVVPADLDVSFGNLQFYLPPEALDFIRSLQYTNVDYGTTPADLLEELGHWHAVNGRFEEDAECLKRANDWREATYGTASVSEIERMRKERRCSSYDQ